VCLCANHLCRGCPTLYGSAPHPLFWAGSLTTHEKITISGTVNSLTYRVIFVLVARFTSVVAGHSTKCGPHAACRQRVGDPRSTYWDVTVWAPMPLQVNKYKDFCRLIWCRLGSVEALEFPGKRMCRTEQCSSIRSGAVCMNTGVFVCALQLAFIST
jgi:hypothetical protein